MSRIFSETTLKSLKSLANVVSEKLLVELGSSKKWGFHFFNIFCSTEKINCRTWISKKWHFTSWLKLWDNSLGLYCAMVSNKKKYYVFSWLSSVKWILHLLRSECTWSFPDDCFCIVFRRGGAIVRLKAVWWATTSDI